jgi:hypothetical protein
MRKIYTKSEKAEYARRWRVKNKDKVKAQNFKRRYLLSFYEARNRCINSKHKRFKDYGGRGIKFLMTKEDFKFLWNRDKAQMMKKPSIDRINNNGHYKLDNCRFIELKTNILKDKKRDIKTGRFIRRV